VTFAPLFVAVAVTDAEEPAAPVVTLPIAKLGTAPRGIPNANVRFAPLLLDVLVTVAELPAESVETLPTVMVVLGGPAGPCGPTPPGAAAEDAATFTTAFFVTAAEIVSPFVATTDGPDLPLTVTLTLTVPSL
jgi:hypothetical protein